MADHEGPGNRRKDQSGWFADALGERWTTAGDGIYRLVDDSGESDLIDAIKPPDPVDVETVDGDEASAADRSRAPGRVAPER